MWGNLFHYVPILILEWKEFKHDSKWGNRAYTNKVKRRKGKRRGMERARQEEVSGKD